jgi:23S rRNA-intervening sequence protein
MSENIVLEKSYKFALRIVKLYKYLSEEKKEFVMSKSLLSRGTAIGERIKSAQEAACDIPGDCKRAFHFSGARRSYTSYPLSTLIRICFPVTSHLRFIE